MDYIEYSAQMFRIQNPLRPKTPVYACAVDTATIDNLPQLSQAYNRKLIVATTKCSEPKTLENHKTASRVSKHETHAKSGLDVTTSTGTSQPVETVAAVAEKTSTLGPVETEGPAVARTPPARVTTPTRSTPPIQTAPARQLPTRSGSRGGPPATPLTLPEADPCRGPQPSAGLPSLIYGFNSSSLSANSVTVMNLPRIYQTFPRRLPSAPDIPPRTNPLDPNPYRRTVALETGDPHWRNEQRALRMKQRDHYRYHNSWSKFYYGSSPEREAYNAYQRAVLKQQMQDKERSSRQQFAARVRESDEATERDRAASHDDVKDRVRKKQYLCTFRDENKRMMEWKWNTRQRTKLEEDLHDRELLKYNPVNWSASLK